MRICPITELNCHDLRCEGNQCQLDRNPFNGRRTEETWERHIISKQLRIIDRLTEEHHHKKHQRVKQVLFTIFNNNKLITMALQLPSNQSAPIVLGLIDADTLLPITATFAGESETSDNPAAATIDPTLGLVGVAPGTGNLTSVATWTYVDKNTGQNITKQLTTVTPFTITAVISAENVSMTVTLGTPVTQP